MLRQTFCHIQGIGPASERKLWQRGIRDWSSALGEQDLSRLHPDLSESEQRFAAREWKWFDQRLPAGEKWRAFGDFGSQALYVDIETDGGLDEESITVIGCFDGHVAHTFVRGRDLEKAKELIEDAPLVVTFNGAQFDMPFIRRRFFYNLFNHVHVDLRFPLKRLGFAGGLKKIEECVGLSRGDSTRGLGGWDAVRLWREHEQGSTEALEVLLEYNREDTRNLQPLMKMVYEKLTKTTGFPE